jgi:hypothetical protein
VGELRTGTSKPGFLTPDDRNLAQVIGANPGPLEDFSPEYAMLRLFLNRRTVGLRGAQGSIRALLQGAALLLLGPGLALAQPAGMRVDGSDVVVRAMALLDTPYRYGGRTPAGFDCSGFVGYVVAESSGLLLPRRSEEQSRLGEELARKDLLPGDLVFFNTLGRRFSHVGIYIGDGQFVHAPARRGRVRVESLDDRYWSARYNGARRLGPAPLTARNEIEVRLPAVSVDADVRITP